MSSSLRRLDPHERDEFNALHEKGPKIPWEFLVTHKHLSEHDRSESTPKELADYYTALQDPSTARYFELLDRTDKAISEKRERLLWPTTACMVATLVSALLAMFLFSGSGARLMYLCKNDVPQSDQRVQAAWTVLGASVFYAGSKMVSMCLKYADAGVWAGFCGPVAVLLFGLCWYPLGPQNHEGTHAG